MFFFADVAEKPHSGLISAPSRWFLCVHPRAFGTICRTSRTGGLAVSPPRGRWKPAGMAAQAAVQTKKS